MELPAKLLELVEDPEVRDIVISGDFCAIDKGRGLEAATSPFTEEELEGELRQLAFEAGVRCDIAKPVADLAAIAAADTMTGIIAGIPCENAREIAAGNGASLDSCRIVSEVVSIRVGKQDLFFEVFASAKAVAMGAT